MPKPRTRPVLFSELTDAALQHSEPGDKGTNHSRMKVLVSEFGNCSAEDITLSRLGSLSTTSGRWRRRSAAWP